MTLAGHTTCPHCRAIVQSTRCTICGKSAADEIVQNRPPQQLRWWQLIDRRSVARKAGAVFCVLALGGLTAFALTRPDPLPDPIALPPPSAIANVIASPDTTAAVSSGQAPSVDRGDARDQRPLPELGEVGVDREVGSGLSPWETAPPVNFVTGRLLDVELDFRADIARVAVLIDAFPATLGLDPVESTEILTFGGPIDLDITEQTQPFAARRISDQNAAVGELWLIASGGTAAGDSYLAAARSRWNHERAVDQFAPDPGLRIWKLGEDSKIEMWVSDLTDDSPVIVQAPLGIEPIVLASVIGAWRSNLDR